MSTIQKPFDQNVIEFDFTRFGLGHTRSNKAIVTANHEQKQTLVWDHILNRH